MRYFVLLIGAVLISSCSQNFGSVPATVSQQNLVTRLSNPGPSISKVSKIDTKQKQKIVISGRGFGTMQPYNGDSEYLQIWDITGGWSAGLDNISQDDTVTLNVTSWSDSKIDVAGFTGGWGEYNWTLQKGDHLTINVWNPQTDSGPATAHKKVK